MEVLVQSSSPLPPSLPVAPAHSSGKKNRFSWPICQSIVLVFDIKLIRSSPFIKNSAHPFLYSGRISPGLPTRGDGFAGKTHLTLEVLDDIMRIAAEAIRTYMVRTSSTEQDNFLQLSYLGLVLVGALVAVPRYSFFFLLLW